MFRLANYANPQGLQSPYFGNKTNTNSKVFKSLLSRLSTGDELTLAIKTGQTNTVKQLSSKPSYALSSRQREVLIQETRTFTTKGKKKQLQQALETEAQEAQGKDKQSGSSTNLFRKLSAQTRQINDAHSAFEKGDIKAFNKAFGRVKDPKDFLASYDPDSSIRDPKEGLYQCLSNNLIESPETFPEKVTRLRQAMNARNPNTKFDVDLTKIILTSAKQTHDYLATSTLWEQPSVLTPEVDLQTANSRDSNQRALFTAGMEIALNMSPQAASHLANGGLSKLGIDPQKVPFIQAMQQAIDTRSRQTQSRL